MERSQCFREFAKYSSLNVLGMIGLSCYILADTYFISKGLGANGLAALNLAIPVYSCIHGSGLMLGMGGATNYSIQKGQKSSQSTNQLFVNTLYLGGLFAALFVLAGLFLSETITALLGADAEIFAMTNTYLKVILLFSPAFLCNDIILCFVRNDGNPRLSMIAMLAGSLSNIVLDYIFIFPFDMGIFGAVLATGFAPLIGLSILSGHWRKKRSQLFFQKSRPKFSLVPKILSLGFPSFLAEVSSGIVMIVFNFIILGLQGNIGVAAYGIIANLSLVVIAIYTGIAQGVQPLISRAYGRQEKTTVKRVLRYAVLTVLLLSGLLYLLVFLFADPVARIFNSRNDALLQAIAAKGLKLYFLCAAFAGFNIVASTFFSSVEKALPAHILSLLRGLILLIPLAFLLSSLAGITGVWLSVPAAEGLTAMVGCVFFYLPHSSARHTWKT
ncbi:MATE family efflux transporter [Hominifimenecus sp. rT4P-3]|uniref:MATE family efflux transporter n=1 Tax=Hominifimenecus sp. rT4P-3 TaxID=3242979 RepID=UPI003DA489D3